MDTNQFSFKEFFQNSSTFDIFLTLMLRFVCITFGGGNGILRLFLLSLLLSHSVLLQANVGQPPLVELQEVTPVSWSITMAGSMIIDTAANVGAHGCSINDNVIEISLFEQSSQFAMLVQSITENAIANGENIIVYWKGCLKSGRPKVVNVKPIAP